MDFHKIQIAVAAQFQKMAEYGLFRSSVSKDLLWETYLASFPEGTNPIFKERTEHDCQCCKHFVRWAGGVVSIINGKLVSIWDVTVDEPGYQAVANAMSQLVKTHAIDNIFVHTEKIIGQSKSLQQIVETGNVITWNHFSVTLPTICVLKGDLIGPKLSDTRSTRDVAYRSLKEIDMDSIDTVLDLISQNSLYRGEEHKFAVEAFQGLKIQFDKLKTNEEKDQFCWSVMLKQPSSVSRIRNTAIGTLLQDLSEGMEIENAVKAFETKVAPTNYKRPTALVTKAMIANAQTKVEELGLATALERRYAHLEDITVNNVLFANRDTRKALGANVFDELISKTPETMKTFDKVEEVTIDKFLSDIMPKAESIELLFENRHLGNLVSLIAPVDPTSRNMFKWNNKFSWSYTGEVADSIKERVKQAGGNVTGDFRASLSWFNHDDLDLHLMEPNGDHIYFGNKISPNGGQLDVDMNAGHGSTRTPVENIFYPNKSWMKPGFYKLSVNQFSLRERTDPGFEVEMEFDGVTHHFTYPKIVGDKHTVTVAEFKYSQQKGMEIIQSLESTQSSKSTWNLTTQTFQKVNAIMLSPNHWDGYVVGNKHFFFMLEGCLNEGKARGFFNEFLNSELDPHRKVLEMVGSKMRTDESDKQLSGLGFSSTLRNSVLCRVKGSFTRVVKIMF